MGFWTTTVKTVPLFGVTVSVSPSWMTFATSPALTRLRKSE